GIGPAVFVIEHLAGAVAQHRAHHRATHVRRGALLLADDPRARSIAIVVRHIAVAFAGVFARPVPPVFAEGGVWCAEHPADRLAIEQRKQPVADIRRQWRQRAVVAPETLLAHPRRHAAGLAHRAAGDRAAIRADLIYSICVRWPDVAHQM